MKKDIISGYEAIGELVQKYNNLKWWKIGTKIKIKKAITHLNWWNDNFDTVTLRRK